MSTLASIGAMLAATSDNRSLPPLWFMTDPDRVPDVGAAVDGLPRRTGVIFRHYGAPHRLDIARAVLARCRSRGRLFLLAGGSAGSLHRDVDGIHLPEAALLGRLGAPGTIADLRRAGKLVTAAAHSEVAIRRAAHAGVDAVIVSPVFPTESHPGERSLGPVRLASMARAAKVPVLALGGIGPGNAARLRGTGISGLAGISGFISSDSAIS